MVNQCQNCGAGLRFDIALGRLKCDNCESTFSPEDYSRNVEATEQQNPESGSGIYHSHSNYEATIFTCPNCGAELAGNEGDAVDYCMYCGSFVTLRSRIAKIKRPDGILPFEKTKEECTEIYRKMIRKKFYAPKEFRDDSFLQSFRGAYIPYWVYDYSFGPQIYLQGSDDSTEGDYTISQEYTVSCDMEGVVSGITFDASSTFDDCISEKIAPFDSSKIKPFQPSFMFSFFSDTADVESEVSEEQAHETATEEIWNQVTSQDSLKEYNLKKPESVDKIDSAFHTKKSQQLSLLPVWFLTWRKGDRVAYSAVNGESGAIYSEIPIDPLRYIFFSLALAVPIFLLLNMGFTFLGNEMLTLALIFSAVTIILYMVQLEHITRRQFHADDKGYLSVHKKARENVERDISENVLVAFVNSIKELFEFNSLVGLILSLGGAVIALFVLSELIAIGLFFAVILVPPYVIYRIIKCARVLDDYFVFVDVAGSLIAFIVSAVILILDPAQDFYYYGAAIFCIVAVAITALLTIRRYNQLITRPLPRWEEDHR